MQRGRPEFAAGEGFVVALADAGRMTGYPELMLPFWEQIPHCFRIADNPDVGSSSALRCR